MIYRKCLILFMFLCLLAEIVRAQQPVSVVIMPFETHAQDDLSYLQTQIPQAIKSLLDQEGADVLIYETMSISSWQKLAESRAEIRNIGVQTGADYIVWGSLTLFGQNFSLDAKLLASEDGQEPDTAQPGHHPDDQPVPSVAGGHQRAAVAFGPQDRQMEPGKVTRLG